MNERVNEQSPDFLPGTHRSKERPHAMTDTFSGSPMGRSISGRKSPEFPTSTHFFRPAGQMGRTGRHVCGVRSMVGRRYTGLGVGEPKPSRGVPQISIHTQHRPLTLVVAEHLHAGLGVRVVGWLETQLSDPWRGRRKQAGDPGSLPVSPDHLPVSAQLACSPSLVKNSRRTPMRWPRVSPWSATTPSIWWNSARCVASRVSFRNTRSMEKYLVGTKGF
jgi:hypothetical protein